MNPPFAPIPTKTPLGVEEQRRRSAGLGQRHRTILFLVDGRRPLGEVLRLAQQAGATVQHFEDLVRLGHIDVPRPPDPPAPLPTDEVDGEAAEAGDGADSAAGELAEVPLPLPQAEPLPEPEPTEAAAPDAPADAAAPVAADAEASAPAAQEPAPAAPEPAPTAPVPAASFAHAPVLPVFSLDLPAGPPAPPVLGEVAVPRISGARLLPAGPPPWRKRLEVAAPLSREDEKVIGAARERLLEALDRDPPLFSWGLGARIRSAATAPALVDLTLELERTLDRRRRSPAGLAALEAARELLGLGNTVIAEDSEPAWADTR